MTTLAPKLPYSHPFSGGYPRIGGQPLPTDPDAIDYLNRQAAVDGPVEVGVAMAVDAFVKGCKADGIWSAIKASCILCGARTISGALVPLVGAAPTAYSFASGDYDRSSGLKGDGSTKYLDSNRANNADGKDDNHNAVWVSEAQSSGGTGFYIDSGAQSVGDNNLHRSAISTNLLVRNRTQFVSTLAKGDATGFIGHSRSSSSTFSIRAKNETDAIAATSESPSSGNINLFARPGTAFTNARLAFYSIGSAIPDLAALDTRVSTLVSAIAAAL